MQTEQQREADKRYRLKHPEKLKEKDAKRYRKTGKASGFAIETIIGIIEKLRELDTAIIVTA